MKFRNPKTGETNEINPATYLYGKQSRKINSRPELVIQFAHYMADVYQDLQGVYPEVYANVSISTP